MLTKVDLNPPKLGQGKWATQSKYCGNKLSGGRSEAKPATPSFLEALSNPGTDCKNIVSRTSICSCISESKTCIATWTIIQSWLPTLPQSTAETTAIRQIIDKIF